MWKLYYNIILKLKKIHINKCGRNSSGIDVGNTFEYLKYHLYRFLNKLFLTDFIVQIKVRNIDILTVEIFCCLFIYIYLYL